MTTRTTCARELRASPTKRGNNVRELVAATAANLLRFRSFLDVPLVELARVAGLARASLLQQYRQGWPDVLLDVALRQLCPDPYYGRAEAVPELPPEDRVCHVLDAVLEDAQRSGRLYANLRAASFVWNADLFAINAMQSQDFVGLIALLMEGAPDLNQPSRNIESLRLAEGLYELTMDLAAQPAADERDWAERRATVRVLSLAAVGALCHSGAGGSQA